MTDTPNALSPIAVSDFALLSRPLGHAVDESLFLEATARWQDSRQRLLQLTADTPSVRASIAALLKQELNLDGESVQVHFASSSDRPERYIKLTEACAFVQEFPPLHISLNQQCRIIGLPEEKKHYATQPVALLHRLKTLNVRHALRTGWITYWLARAPGTAMSRRDLAIAQYSTHVQAAAQLACALGSVTADQLKPLLTVLDPPAGELQVNGQKIYVEQLLLKRTGHLDAELPGALVITLDAEIVLQLLYVPSRQPALMIFNDRVRLEQWLLDQPGLFPGVTQAQGNLIDYRPVDNSLHAGLTQLLELRLEEQQNSLSSNPSSNLAEHGHKALEAADRVDQQQRDRGFFPLPPTLPASPLPDDGDADERLPMAFAGLTADLPLEQRRSALEQHQQAFKTLLGADFQDDPNDENLRKITTQLNTLHEAQQEAHQAATALLNQQPQVKLLELSQQANPDYHALLKARLKGLISEANLQRQLNQISSNEHDMLMAAFDPLNAPRPELKVAVTTLTLSITEQTNGEKTTQSKELDGVLLITLEAALLDPSSPQELLLYWPGSSGGLQRFDSRQALEQWLVVPAQNTSSMTLDLALLNATAFDYSLTVQLDSWVDKIEELFRLAPDDTERQANGLDAIRVEAIHELGVPIHAARELAYAQILEQNQSAALAKQLPQWLGQVSITDRAELKAQTEAYLLAFQRAEDAHEQKLPLSSTFCKKRLYSRLARDFSLKQPFSVQLDLPESVTREQHFIEAPGAPGTPTKTVPVPSATRVKMSLDELALSNIDPVLSERLTFMKVEVRTQDAAERQTLTAALTATYLRNLVPELNLAQHYEDLIRETYQGSDQEAPFTREHRHERLLEPHRLMLKLQGRQAFLQKTINSSELHTFNIAIAIDATTPDAWRAEGNNIELRPAFLSAGEADTQDGPSTLSGITFIHQKNTGSTLLYLPESPDGQYLRRYTSLEAARMALFNLCLGSTMVNYLAGRALLGTVASHVYRINQAMLKNFNGLIGVGVPWPATTSLATHLLNAHMGQLIEAHRATSRSNSALYLERYAMKGVHAFNYIKMAIGIVPVAGTVIGLYDGWNSANEAVDAFRRGDHVQGMQGITQVLQSLIDAGMDVAGGVAIGPSAARTRTIARHLRNAFKGGGYLQPPMGRKARHIALRFKGYEYEKEITLAHLQPVTQGLYRQVYRHADGNFILRQGNVYQIELQNGHWRLSGNSLKKYKQPIALDEAGQWDTHFGVYGSAQPGGLAGGGGVLGHLADRMDPIWPLAIRRQLPTWWTNGPLRRQLRLTDSTRVRTERLGTQSSTTNSALERYYGSDTNTRSSLEPAVDTACTNDIDIARSNYLELAELLPLSHGNKRSAIRDVQSRCAWIVVDRMLHRVRMASGRIITFLDVSDALAARSDATPVTETNTHLHLLEQRKNARVGILKEIDLIDAASDQINTWSRRITADGQKSKVAAEIATLNKILLDSNRHYMRTGQYLEIISRYDAINDTSWFYLQAQMAEARSKVGRALFTQLSLTEVRANLSQRNQILQDCIDTYDQFRRQLNAWTASYPQHFHSNYVAPLMDGLEKMGARANNAIKQPPSAPQPGQSIKKIFETEDNKLLIGEPAPNKNQFTISGVNGRNETWGQAANGKYRLQEDPSLPSRQPVQTDVEPLLAEARNRLNAQDTYKLKVEGYARQNMLPIDLEHMMASEAAELDLRAQQIERLAPRDATINQLRNKATELTASGRTLRISQSLSSKTPTEGYLDYLLEPHPVDKKIYVDIKKTGGLRDLGKRPDGRHDFLQEYEVRDLTQDPPRSLWYAHFHYDRVAPQFSDFVKAHLKLPEQRNLGLQWQQAQAASGAKVDSIWRGSLGKPLASKHFQNLF